MTTYFVDAQSALTTAASVTGDINIEVSDASFLSAGIDIFIGSESYAIDSINSNTITLASGTTVDYGTDIQVRIDDTALDGLTPATAKSSIFISGADNANTFEIWVKPGSNELMKSAKVAQYLKVISWPKTSAEHYYSERPQAGIDAGWDSISGNLHLDMETHTIDCKAVSDNKIEVSNATISAAEAESAPLFYVAGCDIIFNNTNITSLRDGNQYESSIVKFTQNTYNTITVNKCVIIGLAGNFISSNRATSIHVYRTTINITDSEVRSKMFFHTYTHSNMTTYAMNINVTRSVIFADYLYYSHEYRGYSNGENFLNVVDSEIVVANSIYDHAGFNGNQYNCVALNVTARNSILNSGGEMFRYGTGGFSNTYFDHEFILENCEISCNAIIRADKYSYELRFRKPIRLLGCSVTARGSYLFYLTEITSYKQIVIQGTRSMSCKGLIYANVAPDDANLLIIDNANLGSNIVTTTGKSNITIHNSVVAGKGGHGGNNVHTKAYGCSMYGEDGNHTAEYRNCFISPSGTGFFGNGSFTISRECKFSEGTDLIAFGKNTKAIIIDSELEVDLLKTPEFADIRIFNSIVKGVNTPYADFLNAMVKKISPIYRVGGGNGSVYVTPVLARKVSGTVEEVIGMVSSSAKTVRFYIASNGDLEKMSKLGTYSIQYVDVNGNRRMASLELKVDNDSNWDGLELSNSKFYLEYNVESTDMDKSKQVSLYSSVSLDIEGVSEVWFDLDLGFTF